MFDERHYVPILQARRAELIALRDLTGAVTDKLTPLFEVPYTQWINPEEIGDAEPDAVRASNLSTMLTAIPPRIAQYWGKARPVFLDTLYAEQEGTPSSGLHPVTHLFDAARNEGLPAIPATGLDRDAAQRAAVREVVAQDGRGVCIRLLEAGFGNMGLLNAQIESLLEGVGVGREHADLVIDLGPMQTGSEPSLLTAGLQVVLSSLAGVNDWRTLTIAGSAFPQNLGFMSANSEATVPRSEWLLWQGLWANRAQLPRMPTFGDYAIDYPDRREPSAWWTFTISPQLRYTADTYWICTKGRRVKDGLPWRFPEICARAINRAEFRGRAFSPGDAYIEDAAPPPGNLGTPETWRRCGFSHHLATVVEQISNLP